MFRREEHRAISRLLGALDRDLLERCAALFAGGTRLVLEFDEYRLSNDVDFLCSDPRGYSELRRTAREAGPRGFFAGQASAELEFPREVRFDQYGIRFIVVASGLPIKFEIIREARIDLDFGLQVEGLAVPCTSWVDCFAEKLLANSDRWADSQVLARDVIDLGMLRRRVGAIPAEAWRKTEAAYGTSVRDDLAKALLSFQENPDFQQRCFTGLQVGPAEEIMLGLASLAHDLEFTTRA